MFTSSESCPLMGTLLFWQIISTVAVVWCAVEVPELVNCASTMAELSPITSAAVISRRKFTSFPIRVFEGEGDGPGPLIAGDDGLIEADMVCSGVMLAIWLPGRVMSEVSGSPADVSWRFSGNMKFNKMIRTTRAMVMIPDRMPMTIPVFIDGIIILKRSWKVLRDNLGSISEDAAYMKRLLISCRIVSSLRL